MGTYVAFLRGINLGQTKKISMPQLRGLAEELGYAEVRTYINSGNLIFSSSKGAATLEQEIGQAIKETLGHSVDVAVRTPAQLSAILAANPYPDGNPSQVTVAFLIMAAPATARERVAAVATDHEPFTIVGSEVYVHYGDGIGKSKLAERFSAIIGVSSTVRNLRTVEKVLDLSQSRDS